jgi:hypothetical protein
VTLFRLSGVLALVLAAAGDVGAGDLDPAVVQLWDVIYTADGGVLKGVIVEEVPGTSVRIVMAGGSTLVVPVANVTKLGKELNPGFAMTARPVQGGAGDTGAPARKATSGVRLAVMPGIAQHVNVDYSTFLVAARAGYELGFDQWGVTPGLVVEVTPGSGPYGDEPGLSFMPSLRAAYRGSSISPFVNFGVGLDALRGDTSLGTFMGAGIELLVHRSVALTAEVRYHRGWGDTYTYTLEYVGGGMGVEVRL